MKRILLGFAAALLLLCASAAAYDDLPASHWARGAMTRAASLGIMNGVTENLMQPDGPLTWAQYLAMASRAFAPEAYRAASGGGAAWHEAGWRTAQETGLLWGKRDFLPVTQENMRTARITRQDAAVLLCRALDMERAKGDESAARSAWENWHHWISFHAVQASEDAAPLGGAAARDTVLFSAGASNTPTPAPTPPRAKDSLSDFYRMDGNRQEAVSRLFALGVIRGKADGTFGPQETIRRCDGAVLLMRTLEQVDAALEGRYMSLTVQLLDETGFSLGSPLASTGYVGLPLSYIAERFAPKYYKAVPQTDCVSSACHTYAVQVIPVTPFERQRIDAEEMYRSGEILYEDYAQMDFWLYAPGNNPRKRILLYGVPDVDTYLSAEEAEGNMVSVRVPVWRLNGKNKVPSSMSVEVHQALAEEILAIFQEIYDDPEQFPIESIGGYNHWGGTIPDSEHRNGTAVDLNPDANYQVRDGRAMAGSHWTPGADPYSIPANSSVVRAFEAHGWTWGGSWPGHTDPARGYHDYMHFSYRGR